MEENSVVFGLHVPADNSSYFPENCGNFPDGISNNVEAEVNASPKRKFDLNEPPPTDDDADFSNVIHDNDIVNEGSLSEEQIMEKRFNSEEEAYDWYLLYAFVNGFGIRRDNRRCFDKYGQQIKSRIFVCARQGHRLKKCYLRPERKREHKDDTRCDCPARIRIARSTPNEQFRVKQVTSEHSHPLADPKVTHKLRCHRKVSQHDLEHVISLREVGIRTCEAFQLMVSQAGGYAKVGYTVKDLYNKLQSLRKAYSNSGDGQLALQYIDTLEHTHGGVFKSFQLGENQQLQSIFWRDERCKRDYVRFGDVLVLDSTYKTNMYLKPLVILSGVNNHFQTCVFAVAVLQDETTESYKWVLNCFLEAMDNKVPISVITDGDLAMKAAIAEVLPLAKHRLCAWHLCRNAEGTLKLGSEFMKDFRKCLSKRSDVNQWNDDWQYMVDKWGIANKRWVTGAYMTRNLWAEAFLKEFFFAGQTTTQRCESINKFFKQYLNCKNNLLDLIKGIMRGIEKLRGNERGQHCTSDQSLPVLTSQFKLLEEHAAMFYTRAVFAKFREQARKASQYKAIGVEEIPEYDMDAIYVTREKARASLHTVFCQRDNNMLYCSCKRFESSHMVCGHIIFVLFHKGVQFIPENLLSKRWQKTDSDFYKNDPAMHEPKIRWCDDPKTQAFRRGCMKGRMEMISDMGGTSQETYDYWQKHVDLMIRGLKDIILKQENGEEPVVNVNSQEYAHVMPPSKGDTKPKGSSKNVRKKCGRCQEYGHNRTTCPNPPVGVSGQDVGQSQSQASQQTMISNCEYNWSEGMGDQNSSRRVGNDWTDLF